MFLCEDTLASITHMPWDCLGKAKRYTYTLLLPGCKSFTASRVVARKANVMSFVLANVAALAMK
jgi:hypothetical protein